MSILTLAINGYDDGASTGEVRRFLGDALGPSDFRKNASRLATARASCAPALVRLLDRRLPDGVTVATVATLASDLSAATPPDPELASIDAGARTRVASRLQAFLDEHARSGRPFRFDDCAVGNLVFAGAYLLAGRRFNDAVDDYAALVGVRPGVVENVTDGSNAFLVAIDRDGRVLGSEADIVDATQRNAIDDIFLVRRSLDVVECSRLTALGKVEATARLDGMRVASPLNPRLAAQIANADLLIYAPGTQHSSLFPSYLTPGPDTGDRVERARDQAARHEHPGRRRDRRQQRRGHRRARRALPEGEGPAADADARAHHPLPDERARWRVARRAVRAARPSRHAAGSRGSCAWGSTEEGVTGRHDALKVLAPFVRSVLQRRRHRRRVAVVLYDAGSVDKLALTLIEMVRGGTADLPLDVTVFCETATHARPGVRRHAAVRGTRSRLC